MKLTELKQIIIEEVRSIIEGKSVKSLKSDYDKAIKKEQSLSSLMLTNLVKYKQAKTSGDEKAIAKYTKIAGQLSPKKKAASELANTAYQAYEDKISGLHADAELELKEVDMKDDTEFTVSLKHLTKKHVTKGGELEEGLARGLKPLLKLGSTIKSTVGEKVLVKLSDEFDDIDDEQGDDVASSLNMAIELMQDRSPSEARAWLKKFNKACADALSGKSVKSAFENVNEAADHIPQFADDKKYTAAFRKKYGTQKTNKFLSFEIEPLAGSGHFNYRDIEKLAKKNKFGIWDTVRLVNKAYVNQVKGVPMNVTNEAAPRMKEDPSIDTILAAYAEIAKIENVMRAHDTSRHSNVKNEFRKVYKSITDLKSKMQRHPALFGMGEGVLKEMDINDPILVSIRARQTMLKKAKSAPKVKKISTKQYYKLMDAESDLIDQMKSAAKEYERLDSDMNADAGQKGANWSDTDANKYGGDLNKLQTKIEKLAKQKAKVKKAIMNHRVN